MPGTGTLRRSSAPAWKKIAYVVPFHACSPRSSKPSHLDSYTDPTVSILITPTGDWSKIVRFVAVGLGISNQHSILSCLCASRAQQKDRTPPLCGLVNSFFLEKILESEPSTSWPKDGSWIARPRRLPCPWPIGQSLEPFPLRLRRCVSLPRRVAARQHVCLP